MFSEDTGIVHELQRPEELGQVASRMGWKWFHPRWFFSPVLGHIEKVLMYTSAQARDESRG